MVMPRGPVPSVGSPAQVSVNGATLNLIPGTWKVAKADRFGQKISTGALRYQDFNPFESAHSVASLTGGYGLRRYSDVASPDDPVVQTMYDEADDVDCRWGPPILAPQRLSEDTGLDGTVVWMGDITPAAGALEGQTQFVAIGGTKLAHRHTDGSWHVHPLTFPATVRRGAVGIFNGQIIVGFGDAAQAVYTNDLDTITPIQSLLGDPLYVWAFTADRSATYAAGGVDTAKSNQIISSTNGVSDYDTDNALVCSGADGAITSLVPGGGLGLLYVGREHELGSVDNNGIYRVLQPFDSRLATNGQPMRWGLGGVGEGEQRGTVRIFLSRDHSLWAYSPSSDSAGSIQDLSVWGKQGMRPKNIRGITTSMQGTARWFYHVIRNVKTGNSYLLALDAHTGTPHPIGSLGAVTSNAMGVTSLFGDNPILFVGTDTDVVKLTLPLDGENPLDDDAIFYQLSGTLTLPDIELGFPDEDKINLFFRVVGTAEQAGLNDGLQPGDHSIDVELSFDGGPYVAIGTASVSPVVEFRIPNFPASKRAKPRFRLRTNDPRTTPQLLGFSYRVSLNPKVYRIWDFDVAVPSPAGPTGAISLDNPQTQIDAFWKALRAGTPVDFTDRWQFGYVVRILDFGETEIAEESLNTIETRLHFTLLEVYGPTTAPYHLAWGDPKTIWGGPYPNSTWGL